MKKAKMMKKYAQLIAEIGIGANNKQDVVIKAPTEAYQFVRYLTLELYNAKAKSVTIDWSDSAVEKQTLMHVSPSKLDDVPEWIAQREKERTEKNFSRISIIGEDPSIFRSVSGDRLKRYTKAQVEAFYPFKNIYNSNELAWCIAAVPTKAWAKKVFPNLSPTQAMIKLWNCIYEACRIYEDKDAILLWKEHIAELKKHASIMNNYAFKALHYTNSLGTDLTVGLAKGHIWGSAEAVQSRNGFKFVPNLPTEEIFSMPDRLHVDGKVIASKPLSYNGALIDGFSFEFKDGKVINYSAKEGKDKLEEIVNFDANSCRLGEAALVPFDSPISKQGIVYQSTLFDENASCHLALGQSFAENIQGGESMTSDELLAHGGNQSKIHVDFMIGTKDLSIDGIKEDGSIVPVFRNGNFVF